MFAMSPRAPTKRQGLTEEKKHRIVGMLAAGCSRRAAAKAVHLHPATITRGVARDAEFAEAVLAAESHTELGVMNILKQTAGQPRYWRAAAWMLQRRDTQRPTPDTGPLSAEAFCALIDRGCQTLAGMTHRDRRAIFRKLLDAVRQLTTIEAIEKFARRAEGPASRATCPQNGRRVSASRGHDLSRETTTTCEAATAARATCNNHEDCCVQHDGSPVGRGGVSVRVVS